MGRLITLILILGLGGCALVPESIQVPEGTKLVSYSRAVTGGDTVKGETARWGGVIVQTQNKPNKTIVEIVHFPLNHYGRPATFSETVGRFKVVIDGFVDPLVFEEGRSVTFTGEVSTPLAGMVGEQPYMYPALAAKDYHMWRKQAEYDVSLLYFDYYTGWYSPFYRPYFHPYHRYYHRPRTRRVRVIQRNSPAKVQPKRVNVTTRSVGPSRNLNKADRNRL